MKKLRIYILCVFVIMGGAAVSSRLFFLQVSKQEYYLAQAQSQHQFSKTILPMRGQIYGQDRFGELVPLAVNKNFDLVFAIPKEIKEPRDTAAELARILKLPETEIFSKVSKSDDPYELIKRRLSEEEVDQLKNFNKPGIYLGSEPGRFYPSGSLAAHVIGFTVPDKNEEINGQYGLEEYYDEELAGLPGIFEGDKDPEGYWISGPSGRDITPAEDGANLILSLDPNIQFEAEKLLDGACEKWQVEKGTVIVMEPQSGKILAMANWPTFDPNEYNKFKVGVFLNQATQSIYEPGSAFKPFTMAAGLDSGSITPETTYTDRGSVKFGGYTIKNYDGKGRGVINMITVLEQSLNTGTVFIEQKTGKEKYRDYIEKFGFGEKTGIDLPAEVKGRLTGLDSLRDINYATASFGQGIAVTPIEIIRGLAALANGGKLVKPYIVEKIDYGDGKAEEIKPEVDQEVISGQTSAKISAMMVSVVNNGQARRAQIPGYLIAGKTGTAQIPNPSGGYYSDVTLHNFLGFAPAFNPRFAILVIINKPKGIQYAEGSTGPVFRDLTKYLLDYYQIPPDG